MSNDDLLSVELDATDAHLTHSLEEPFPETSSAFMLWLTREEWQFVFCTSLAYQIIGELNSDLDARDFFRAVLAMCQHDDGHEWEGVDVDDDGRVWPKQSKPVCYQNVHWIAMLKPAREVIVGDEIQRIAPPRPDLEVHFPVALDYCNRHAETLAPHHSVLADAWHKVQNDFAAVRSMRPSKEQVERLQNVIGGRIH